jgi:hypothetical protein
LRPAQQRLRAPRPRTEPPIGIEPMTYALRAQSVAARQGAHPGLNVATSSYSTHRLSPSQRSSAGVADYLRTRPGDKIVPSQSDWLSLCSGISTEVGRGAPSTKDLGVPRLDGNAASVFNTASVALIGALDHLRAWSGVVAMDLGQFSVTCVLALHPGSRRVSASSAHLVASTARPTATCASGVVTPRSCAALKTWEGFQRDAGKTGDAANATALSQRLFAAARADGYVTLDADGKERLTISPPSMIDLFNWYDQPYGPVGVPAWLYRVLSGYAHAGGRCCAARRNLTSRDSKPACARFVWIGRWCATWPNGPWQS